MAGFHFLKPNSFPSKRHDETQRKKCTRMKGSNAFLKTITALLCGNSNQFSGLPTHHHGCAFIDPIIEYHNLILHFF